MLKAIKQVSTKIKEQNTILDLNAIKQGINFMTFLKNRYASVH